MATNTHIRSSHHSRESSMKHQQQQRLLQDDEHSSCTTNPELSEGLMASHHKLHASDNKQQCVASQSRSEYAVDEEPHTGRSSRSLAKSSDFYPSVDINSSTRNPEVHLKPRHSSSRLQTEHQEYPVHEEPSPGKSRRSLTKSSDFYPSVDINSLTKNPEVHNQRRSSSKLQTERQNLAVEKEKLSGKSCRSLTKSSEIYLDADISCSTKNLSLHVNQRSSSSRLQTEHPGDQSFSSIRSGSAPRGQNPHSMSQSPEENRDGRDRSSTRSYQVSHHGQQCSSSHRREHPADQATTPDGKRYSISKSQDVQDDLSLVSSMNESPIQHRGSSQLQKESTHEQIRSSSRSHEGCPNGQQHSLSHSSIKPVRSSTISVNSFAEEGQTSLAHSGMEHSDDRKAHSGDNHRSYRSVSQLSSEIHNEEQFEYESDKLRSSVELSTKEQRRSLSQSHNDNPSDPEAYGYEKRRSHSKSGSSSQMRKKHSYGSICHSTHSGDQFVKQSSSLQSQNRSPSGQVCHSVQSCKDYSSDQQAYSYDKQQFPTNSRTSSRSFTKCPEYQIHTPTGSSEAAPHENSTRHSSHCRNNYPSDQEPCTHDKKSSLTESENLYHDSAKNSFVPPLDLSISEGQTPSELPLDVKSRSSTGSHEMYPNLLRHNHQSHDDKSFKSNGYSYEVKPSSTRSDAFNNETKHSSSQPPMNSADDQIKVPPADVTESCTEEEESDTVILQADGSWTRVTENRVSSRASAQSEQASNDEINEEFKASVAQLNHVLEKMEARMSAGQQDLGGGSDAFMAEVTKLQGRLSSVGMRQSVLHITNQNECLVDHHSGRQADLENSRYVSDSETQVESEVSHVMDDDGIWKPVRPSQTKPPPEQLKDDGKQSLGCRPSQIEQQYCGSGTETSARDESQGDGETECFQRNGEWALVTKGSGIEMPAHDELKSGEESECLQNNQRQNFQIYVDDKDKLNAFVWIFQEDGARVKRLSHAADECISSNIEAGDLLVEINGTATSGKSKREIVTLWSEAQEAQEGKPFQGISLMFARS